MRCQIILNEHIMNNNTIGFSNFRRFIDFPEMTLGGITILVGENNAGKSTLVKAMLLMRDFLKSRIEGMTNSKMFEPQFRFDTEHVNIGEFYRAFCRQSSPEKDTISFIMRIGNFRFGVDIRGERKSGIIPQVSKIVVSDSEKGASFTFDFIKKQIYASFDISEEKEAKLKEWQSIVFKIGELNTVLFDSTNVDEISRLKSEIANLEKQADELAQKNDLGNEGIAVGDFPQLTEDSIGKLLIPELINCFIRYAESGTPKSSESYKIQEANKEFLRGKNAVIKSISKEIEKEINKQKIEYIYAHSVNQNALYANCANSEDYMKRIIHEFYTSRISPGDVEFEFVENWLKEFKIGYSFYVIKIERDDAYYITIFDDKQDKRGIDLADKGMGTIQVVVLLLRIATLIRKFKGQQLTILLEEPEQNLHPKLQSKLADVVHRVNKYFGVRFVIETHSEYLVRKTQVIVADNNYENEQELKSNNPFCVYYLPYDDAPYEMDYALSGRFINKFGEGFFDEAGKSNLITLRKEKELQR